MTKFKNIGFTVLIFSVFFLFSNTYAKNNGNDKDKKKTSKINTNLNVAGSDPSLSVIDVGNITSYIQNDGTQPAIVGGQSWNGYYPKGTGLGAIYQEGIVWGGLVNDGQSPLVRVGGATYSTGNVAIKRLFRVRPDYQSADLTDDAANFYQITDDQVTSTQIATIKAQYAKDAQEWPGDQGAPYQDVNKNGKYDPGIDIPGVPGAAQTVWIDYNDSQALTLYSSNPIGIEVQETFWGYSTGTLANIIFKRVRLIYTGTSASANNSEIDSMYVAQFADPDVGNYSDDFAGSDTTLNLDYAYNSTAYDAKYSTQGLIPPAVGYVFLQGASYYTGNPSDSAVINFQYRKGYKYFTQKSMSSALYFAAGGNWSDPTLASNGGNYDNGTLQMYNMMRGYLPSPAYPSATPYPRPDQFGGPEGGFGTYLLSGDPVTQQGWVDGILEPAGDRRLLAINGPLTMHLHDTVEVVVALVAGEGTNYLSSVSTLKYNDSFAQFAYDNLFNIPTIATPTVTSAALDKKVVLNWGEDTKTISSIENDPHDGYTFQAYSVYQLPAGASTLAKAVRIATYDVKDNVTVLYDNVFDQSTGLTYSKPIQFLNNTGISRFIEISQDVINSAPLNDGQNYTFAVTAIGYNNTPGLPYHILESAPAIINITPHTPNPGTSYSYTTGDTIKTKHLTGASDGNVYPIVIDPTELNGHNYKVTFDSTGKLWSLIDLSANNKVILANQTNLSGDDNYSIVGGMMIKVQGPTPGIKANSNNEAAGLVEINYSGKPLITSQFDAAGTPFNGNTVWHSLNSKETERYYVSAGGGGGTLDRLMRNNDAANAVPYDYELKFTDTTSVTPDWAVWGFDGGQIGKVPFQLWRFDPVTHDSVRLIPILYSGGGGNPGYFGVKNTDAFFGYPCTDWIYWYYDPAGYTAFAAACAAGDVTTANNFGQVEYFGRMVFGDFDGDGKIAPPGTIVKIITTKPNAVSDSFTFTAVAAVTNNLVQAKNDVNMINVFPNPYYGYQSQETSREGKFITFNHLPQNAKIRIFDLAGVLVRTLNKFDASQFTTWDLRNDNNLPVASGIYIAYIDMPDLGKTKILKIAIIQETQVLPVY